MHLLSLCDHKPSGGASPSSHWRTLLEIYLIQSSRDCCNFLNPDSKLNLVLKWIIRSDFQGINTGSDPGGMGGSVREEESL